MTARQIPNKPSPSILICLVVDDVSGRNNVTHIHVGIGTPVTPFPADAVTSTGVGVTSARVGGTSTEVGGTSAGVGGTSTGMGGISTGVGGTSTGGAVTSTGREEMGMSATSKLKAGSTQD